MPKIIIIKSISKHIYVTALPTIIGHDHDVEAAWPDSISANVLIDRLTLELAGRREVLRAQGGDKDRVFHLPLLLDVHAVAPWLNDL